MPHNMPTPDDRGREIRSDSDLTGKILIAMPAMGDTQFARAVVLICAYSDEGAMGIVLNRNARDTSFRELLEMLDIEDAADAPEISVRVGGPVEPGRGFVIHLADGHAHDGKMDVGAGLELTTTRDILENLAQGRGPDRAVLALGYAGWGPGQLDDEIRANGWLTGDMRQGYVFGDPAAVWGDALKALGVDPVMLSVASGRA